MVILNRNKRKIYVCAVVKEGNLKIYKEPKQLYENYRVTDTEADLEAFGMDAYMYVRIQTNINNKDYYHIGDRVYINNKPPKEHDKLCKDADYEVYTDPVPSLNSLTVLLKRRSGK